MLVRSWGSSRLKGLFPQAFGRGCPHRMINSYGIVYLLQAVIPPQSHDLNYLSSRFLQVV